MNIQQPARVDTIAATTAARNTCFNFITTLQKAKTGALPDARQGSAASVSSRPASLGELFHFFTVA